MKRRQLIGRRSANFEDSVMEDMRKEDIFQSIVKEHRLNQSCSEMKLNITFDNIVYLDETKNDIQPQEESIRYSDKAQVVQVGIENTLETVKLNVKQIIADKINESPIINITLMIISIVKIVGNIYSISTISYAYAMNTWFMLMLISDIINLIITYAQYQSVRSYNITNCRTNPRKIDKRESSNHLQGRHSYYSNLINEIQQWESQILPTPAPKKVIKYMSLQRINYSFYIVLIIWGITQYDQDDVLFNVFLYLGLAYLIVQVIYSLSYNCCFAQIMANYLLFSKYDNDNQVILLNIQEVIQSLQRTSYQQKDPGICFVCVSPIKHLDQIILLNCNNMHYYHEECIKKWLLTQLICPICQIPVQSNNYQMNILQ